MQKPAHGMDHIIDLLLHRMARHGMAGSFHRIKQRLAGPNVPSKRTLLRSGSFTEERLLHGRTSSNINQTISRIAWHMRTRPLHVTMRHATVVYMHFTT